MTLTIETSPETEARLRAKARENGEATEEYVQALVERELSEPSVRKPRRRVTGYGKFAHIPVRSEDVHRSRREEVALEEAQEARRAAMATIKEA